MPGNQDTFTQKDRVRRAGIVCVHFLRNLAYYRAGWSVRINVDGYAGSKSQVLRRNEAQFWRTVNSNCLDICVLEWCKLFAERDGKHGWEKVVSDPSTFIPRLLAHLGVTEAAFKDYADDFRRYRDKFIAHLPEVHTMNIPFLRVGGRSVAYLYADLINQPTTGQYFQPGQPSAGRLYRHFRTEGMDIYSRED